MADYCKSMPWLELLQSRIEEMKALRALRPPQEYTSLRCRLLELPPEIREQIWILAVTEWERPASAPKHDASDRHQTTTLQRAPIRLDRYNRPLPPNITRACRQTRAETLKLYYSQNIFECWQPNFRSSSGDWSQSTCIRWLFFLGRVRTSWLTSVVVMYKREAGQEYDIEYILAEQLGFALRPGTVSSRLELTEYEMCFEELGLPRQFRVRRDGRGGRWRR